MDISDTLDGIGKRTLAIVIAAILVFLGLAIWGGSKLGESRAAEQNEETKAQLTSATAELSQLQSASASLQKNNDALRTQIDSVQADLSLAQSRIGTFEQDNAALRTQLVTAETGLSQMQSLYGGLQDSSAALLTQLSQGQAAQNALQQDNAALRTQLASAQAQVSQAQSTQSSLQQDNAALRTQVASWNAWLRNAPPALAGSAATAAITSPGITLGPTSGLAGTPITVTGSGFAANTYGSVLFDINRNAVADSGEPVQYVSTSATGAFSVTLVVPSVTPATYAVLAGFPAGPPWQASATFSITVANFAGGD